MPKKIFAISTLVLMLTIAIIFAYNYAFKKTDSSASSQTAAKSTAEGKTENASSASENTAPANSVSAEATASKQTISAVSDQPAFGAVLAPDNASIYYFSADNGQLNQMDFNGKLEKVVSTEGFKDIQKVAWNKSRNTAIIKRADGKSGSKFLILDLAEKKVSALKNSVDSAAWSNLGDKIIYKYYDSKTGKRTVNVSDPDGGNWRKVADTSFVDLEIAAVPGLAAISFWPMPDAYTATSVDLVNFSGENDKEILKGRYGADLLWSPDGKSAAVSYTDQKGGKKTDLAIMNSDGGQFHSLNFPTFTKKCAWSSDSKHLFCAMPGNISENSTLPDDWQEGKFQTADTFWKIEVATGKKDRLVEVEKIDDSYDVLNPFLSADEKTLFFINKADGKLYKLSF
ncbi:MAG: hypothetical protein PHF35_01530 [Candidatus Moranbacteria bacterium]|nr:hypothetical protein [Candidatus Moranbacteria bacterium]